MRCQPFAQVWKLYNESGADDPAVRTALISQGEIDPDAPLPKTYKELERANADRKSTRLNSSH